LFLYAIHTVLTGNGMAFAELPKNSGNAMQLYFGGHISTGLSIGVQNWL